MSLKSTSCLLVCSFFVFAACSNPPSSEDSAEQTETITQENSEMVTPTDNGSISLPEGFSAEVFADQLGGARHIAVDSDGDVYINLAAEKNGSGLVALRDEDGDGKAEVKEYFEDEGGTGIRVYGGYLYYSSNEKVYRRKFKGDELVPSGGEEVIAVFPKQNQHEAKSFAIDGSGNIYVNVGAPSNACQEPSRTPGVAGQDPCPLLEEHGGIWKFSLNQTDQEQSDGTRYATGIRNAVGITWNDNTDKLYIMQHGRDQLHQFWPELYTEKDNAELPAEEMFEVQEGDDFGWPYCYYDQRKDKKLLNPEYGGDGEKVGRCDQYEDPIVAFPGHWAPNAIEFYGKSAFPEKYHNGAFVAFHGSWNRAPLPQEGYKVVFVPFENGKPTGDWQEFATEFANDGGPITEGAEYRPCGLAIGPDGALYISDSSQGRIWKVTYKS